jgi:hypothetical protein
MNKYPLCPEQIEAIRTEHESLAEADCFTSLPAREVIGLIEMLEEASTALTQQIEASNYMICVHCAKKLPKATDAKSLLTIYLEHVMECTNSPIHRALRDIERVEGERDALAQRVIESENSLNEAREAIRALQGQLLAARRQKGASQ